jgi:hypothetical protein
MTNSKVMTLAFLSSVAACGAAYFFILNRAAAAESKVLKLKILPPLVLTKKEPDLDPRVCGCLLPPPDKEESVVESSWEKV